MVFCRNVYLTPSKLFHSSDDSEHLWIGILFKDHGVAQCSDECIIELPLTTDPLRSHMESLGLNFDHNFMLCIMTMASQSQHCTTRHS